MHREAPSALSVTFFGAQHGRRSGYYGAYNCTPGGSASIWFTGQSISTEQTHCNELQDATTGNHGEFGEPEAITSLAKPLSPPERTSEAAGKGISTLRASISDAHVEQCIGQSATPNLETSPTSPTVPGDPLAPTPAAVKSTEHDQAILTIDLTSPEGLNDGRHGALAKSTIPPETI